jgi:hypothetical protein
MNRGGPQRRHLRAPRLCFGKHRGETRRYFKLRHCLHFLRKCLLMSAPKPAACAAGPKEDKKTWGGPAFQRALTLLSRAAKGQAASRQRKRHDLSATGFLERPQISPSGTAGHAAITPRKWPPGGHEPPPPERQPCVAITLRSTSPASASWRKRGPQNSDASPWHGGPVRALGWARAADGEVDP